MGKINSKAKGKAGELELSHKLQEYGYKVRRTNQYCGNTQEASDCEVFLVYTSNVKGLKNSISTMLSHRQYMMVKKVYYLRYSTEKTGANG